MPSVGFFLVARFGAYQVGARVDGAAPDPPSPPASFSVAPAALRSPVLRQPSFESFDRRVTRLMAAYGITLLRQSIGCVYLWFGALKLFPGLSPADSIAGETIHAVTFGLVPPGVSLPLLAAWEIAIGLGLLTGRFIRVTIALLLMQMLGTLTPLILFPDKTWTLPGIAPTLEGQYIIKNLVIISGALVVGATARGGRVVAADLDLAREQERRLEQEKRAAAD